MRTAGAFSILALGAGSLASGQDAPDRERQMAELQQRVDALQAELQAMRAGNDGGLEARLDGAVRNSPTEALREPRRLNASAPLVEGLDIRGKLKLRGDFWKNFDEGGGNNDIQSFGSEAQLDFLHRVRENLRINIGLHWADIWGDDTDHGLGGTSRLTNDTGGGDQSIEMRVANFVWEDISGTGVNGTVGRQSIELGSERIIGDDDWRLWRTSFDGFRFDNDLGEQAGQWTIIAVRLHDHDNAGSRELVPGAPPPPDNDPRNNADLFGFYYTVTPDSVGTFDAYVFHLEDPNYPGLPDRTRFTTYGGRWQSPDLSGFGIEVEGATQFGEFNGEKTGNYGFGTYAIHGEGWYRPEGIEYFEGFFAGYDYATGGGDPDENFMQLFPTLHGWFGMTDFFSWTNIQHFNLGATANVGDGEVRVSYHWLRRASDDAGFAGYNYSDATTGGSKTLGQEFDVDYSYALAPGVRISAGLGWFMPGDGFHDMTGVSNDIGYGVLRTTFSF